MGSPLRVGLAYTAREVMAVELRCRDLPVTDDALEEYDSEETIGALEAAIASTGVEVVRLGWGLSALTRAPDTHIVFNICEGVATRSREAQMPAALELLGVPYVGSDPLTLSVALDKHAAKNAVRAFGVEIPRGFLASSVRHAEHELAIRQPTFPMIVKPAYEGSSRGVHANSVVRDRASLCERVAAVVETYRQAAIVEEYVVGLEVTVGVIGTPPRIVGVMELRPKGEPWEVYSLDVKRHWRERVEFVVPASLPEYATDRVSTAALLAFEALGCVDMARVDFRVRQDGTPVFIEINPLPGLNPHSDLPILARPRLSFPQLVGEILQSAMQRHGLVR